MSRKKETEKPVNNTVKKVMENDKVKSLVDELKKRGEFKENPAGTVVKTNNMTITFYPHKEKETCTVLLSAKNLAQIEEFQLFLEVYEKVTGEPFIEYTKDKVYNEFGLDEVGKESFGPFVACAVYYDDEFNKDIFDEFLVDSKDLSDDKLERIAKKLIEPDNGLKYVVVAMHDLKDLEYLMPDLIHQTYDFNDIRKRVANTNIVQAILINEAIRILINDYPNIDIKKSTYDEFVSKDLYYNYLEGKKGESKVHVSDIIEGTEIVYDVEPTKKADTIVNSPSAAASIIASYVRKKFFENARADEKIKVLDPENDHKPLAMPDDNNREKVKKYGQLFIKQHGVEKFNKIMKKNKQENPFGKEKTTSYYVETIRELLEDETYEFSEEDKAAVRID